MKILSCPSDQNTAEYASKKEVIEIVETIISYRESTGHKYYGGAAARIIAQLPEHMGTKAELIDAVEVAFKREESCYF